MSIGCLNCRGRRDVSIHAAFGHCRLLRSSAERLEKGHAAGDHTRSLGKIWLHRLWERQDKGLEQ